MNRAPTGFGKGKSRKRKTEKEKERGHGVPCPYEEKAGPCEAQGKQAPTIRGLNAAKLFGLGGGGMSARPGRPRGLRDLLRGCFVGLGGLRSAAIAVGGREFLLLGQLSRFWGGTVVFGRRSFCWLP